MTPLEIKQTIGAVSKEALFADGFEEALIGYVRRFGMELVPLYDRRRCLQILMDRDGATYEEAVEYFEFNVIGAWVGEGTPAFATILNAEYEVL